MMAVDRGSSKQRSSQGSKPRSTGERLLTRLGAGAIIQKYDGDVVWLRGESIGASAGSADITGCPKPYSAPSSAAS